ncbi:cytidylate kinase family protein [Candidatus Kaiserbacteria bacterium]|nr:cytidylate kinase family protein [Candidatus Kaiserbacteria bacterium]MCB9811393.1 cytidylate kinase family protein [Candidatus Nomurabacteria bacterium]
MHRPHIITLSGKPGSGKSSTSDKLAELLGYTRYSSGDLVRKVAKQHHLTLEEFNERAKTDHTLDDKVDEELRKLRDEKDVVIDSRLGFYWIPESFKVYLELDIDLASARIFRDSAITQSRIDSGETGSMQEVVREVKERYENERERFRALYGVDPYNPQRFDLIIDTSRQNPQSVALTIFDNYKQWLKRDEWEQVRVDVPVGYSLQ